MASQTSAQDTSALAETSAFAETPPSRETSGFLETSPSLETSAVAETSTGVDQTTTGEETSTAVDQTTTGEETTTAIDQTTTGEETSTTIDQSTTEGATTTEEMSTPPPQVLGITCDNPFFELHNTSTVDVTGTDESIAITWICGLIDNHTSPSATIIVTSKTNAANLGFGFAFEQTAYGVFPVVASGALCNDATGTPYSGTITLQCDGQSELAPSAEKPDSCTYSVTIGSTFFCEELTTTPQATPPVCEPGTYLNKTLDCAECPPGTCQDSSGASTCNECAPLDIYCGGPTCSNASSQAFSGTTANITLNFPSSEFESTMVLIAGAVAEIFKREPSPDWFRLVSLSPLTFEMKITPEQCGTIANQITQSPVFLQYFGLSALGANVTSASASNSSIVGVKYKGCAACSPGNYTKPDSTCEQCPAGTCQNTSGASSCFECDPTDFFCGGSVCSSQTSTAGFEGSVVVLTATIPLALSEFTSVVQVVYMSTLASALGGVFGKAPTPDWFRISSISAIARRRLLAATSVAMELKISSSDCGRNIGDELSKSAALQQLVTNKLPAPSSFAAEFKGCAAPGALTPELAAQATATTAVVAGVVAAVISTSVAGSVAGSMGGSMAAGASGAAGASVYQLISATQFLNIFGSVMDTRGKASSSRRAGGNTTTTTSDSDSSSASTASSFSRAFGWANMRFDDIFTLRSDTCGGKYLQPFFGVFGTFISSLTGSLALRNVLDILMKRVISKINGEMPLKSLPGFRPGQYEFHVIKTAHLGLCQAAGSVISVAINRPDCHCGWLMPAMWALAICWLVCLPIGFIFFMAAKMATSLRKHRIMFHKLKGGGSWTHYSRKVLAARGTAEDFCTPNVIHVVLRTILGVAGCICVFMGLRAATAKILVDSIVLFVVGTVLGYLATSVGSPVGRRVVVALTNVLAAAIGKAYIIEPNGAVREETRGGGAGRGGVGRAVYGVFGTWLAMMKVALDRGNLKLLRNRGRWLKKDTLKMFYVDFHKTGLQFSLFWMAKNVLIGVLLTGEPVLVEPIVKAWVITILYGFECVIYTFFSPDIDAFNGAKVAFQSVQQFVIIFIGALTVSDAITVEAGANACIQLSIIQVSLAIPEQLWGLLKNTLLRKKGPPKEPEFKMTEAELTVQKEMESTGVMRRYDAAKTSVFKLKALVPVMKRGDIQGLITQVVTDKELLINLNIVKPGCLLPLFQEVFCGDTIRDGLLEVAESVPVVAQPFRAIAENPWETSVEFAEGVEDIFSIKEIIESVLRVGEAITSLELTRAMQGFLQCRPLVLLLSQVKEEVEDIDLSSNPVLGAVRGLFENATVRAAIDNVKKRVSDAKIRDNLERLEEIKLETVEDIKDFVTAVSALCSLDAAAHGFSMAHDVFGRLDLGVAVAFLQRLADNIPEPARSIFCNGLDVAAIVPGIRRLAERLRDLDLGGAVQALLCSPELLRFLDKMSPGRVYPVLRGALRFPAVGDALEECRARLPSLSLHFELLQTIEFESPLDLEDFIAAVGALAAYIPPVDVDVDGVRGAFSLAEDVVAHLDGDAAADVIRRLGEGLPGPAATVFAEAVASLDVVPGLKRVIDCVRRLDPGGAVAALLCTPPLLRGLERLAPGAVLPVLRAALECAPLGEAMDAFQEAVPAAKAALATMRAIQFDAPGDLEAFVEAVQEVSKAAEAAAGRARSFARDVVGRLDAEAAVDIVRRLADNAPEFARGALARVLDVLDIVPGGKRILDRLRVHDVRGAMEAFMCSPPFLRGLEKLAPGAVYPVLRGALRLPAVAAALEEGARAAPSLAPTLQTLAAIPFEAPEDLETFLGAVRYLCAHATAAAAFDGAAEAAAERFSFVGGVLGSIDPDAARAVLRQLVGRVPPPVRRVLQAILGEGEGDAKGGGATAAGSKTKADEGSKAKTPAPEATAAAADLKPPRRPSLEASAGGAESGAEREPRSKSLAASAAPPAGGGKVVEGPALSSSMVYLEIGDRADAPTTHEDLLKAGRSGSPRGVARKASSEMTFATVKPPPPTPAPTPTPGESGNPSAPTLPGPLPPPTKGKRALDFVKMIIRVISKLDPEQAVTIIEKIEDALPDAALVVTEEGFDALYEVAGAACEMKEALSGGGDGSEHSGGAEESHTKRDPEAGLRSGRPGAGGGRGADAEAEGADGDGPRGVVATLREEPENIVLILMGVLGVATIIIFTVIANSYDCGCTCRA